VRAAHRHNGQRCVLNRGRLREQTPAAAFFNQPATPEAAAFLRGELVW
jgi:tungstate transport system ATP-binding protein